MKAESMIAVRPDRTEGTFVGGFVASAAMAALLWAAPAAAEPAVKFESIDGTNLKLVILTAKAVERLGIEMGQVSEQRIVRKQMFGGRLVLPQKIPAKREQPRSVSVSFGQLITQPAPKEAAAVPGSAPAGKVWVRVVLSQGGVFNLFQTQRSLITTAGRCHPRRRK